MSLYNEVRPKDFSTIIGNTAIVSSLKKQVKLEPLKRSHAFLFSGPSGCGKTTLARILATEFKCSGLDLSELNVANTRGIDNVREVITQAHVKPLSGESRVFIFDEAHQIYKDPQNALLKLIEDYPEHSYFIFCSTDPQKIIKTIQNRCSHFTVNLLQDDEMGLLLENVLDVIDNDIPDAVFDAIINSAEGSPRKALTVLESILNVKNEEEQLVLIADPEMEADVINLCRKLLGKAGWKDIAKIYKAIPNKEPEKIRRVILGYMKTVLLSAGNKSELAFNVINIMNENTYDSGEPKLIAMLFDSATI